jgi:hypothetical protein
LADRYHPRRSEHRRCTVAALRGVGGIGRVLIQTCGNHVQHFGAVTLQGGGIRNRFTRLLQVQQLNVNRLLITLWFNGDLITTTVLLIFIQTVPLDPVGG